MSVAVSAECLLLLIHQMLQNSNAKYIISTLLVEILSKMKYSSIIQLSTGTGYIKKPGLNVCLIFVVVVFTSFQSNELASKHPPIVSF